MRNFFYPLDRQISVREFVWCFYSQFDPAQCANRFNVNVYEAAIARKVLMSSIFGTIRFRAVRSSVFIPTFGAGLGLDAKTVSIIDTAIRCCPFSIIGFKRGFPIPIRYRHFAISRALFFSVQIRSIELPFELWIWLRQQDATDFDRRMVVHISSPLATPLFLPDQRALRNQEQRPALLSERYLREVIDTRFPHMFHYLRMGVSHQTCISLEYVFGVLYTQLSVT